VESEGKNGGELKERMHEVVEKKESFTASEAQRRSNPSIPDPTRGGRGRAYCWEVFVKIKASLRGGTTRILKGEKNFVRVKRETHLGRGAAQGKKVITLKLRKRLLKRGEDFRGKRKEKKIDAGEGQKRLVMDPGRSEESERRIKKLLEESLKSMGGISGGRESLTSPSLRKRHAKNVRKEESPEEVKKKQGNRPARG